MEDIYNKLAREKDPFDMQMEAITKHYSLKQSVTLAINSGVDIVLFGNQLGNQDVGELVEVI